MKTYRPIRLLLFVPLALLVSCAPRPAADSATPTDSIVPVRIHTVGLQPIEQVVDFTGTVEPFRQNHISSNAPSRISRIYVEVGDAVRAGQLLVQMDLSAYTQMAAQLENLERDYARLDTLSRVGSVSQQQVDQVRTQLNVLRASFQSLSENTQLRSPIHGIVTGRYFNEGEMYTMTPTPAGKPAIVSVMQLQPVKVLVNVPELHFPRVRPGLGATVTLDIYPNQEFAGTVHLVHPTVDPLTRTFTVEVAIPNRELLIRPGMFARVRFGFGAVERVVVPDIAVQRQPGTNERFVFVAQEGVAARRTVTLGQRIENTLEVLSGLQPGDQVVIAGQARLQDGVAVRPEQ